MSSWTKVHLLELLFHTHHYNTSMMPKLVDTRYRLNDTEIGSNTSTTSAPCDDETPVSLEHDEVAECQRTAAQKLGYVSNVATPNLDHNVPHLAGMYWKR